jgi:hypothetical protein
VGFTTSTRWQPQKGAATCSSIGSSSIDGSSMGDSRMGSSIGGSSIGISHKRMQ